MKLFSLAFRNIKKSIKDYSIYFLTLVIAVAIFYIFNSIDSQTAMMSLNKLKMDMIESLVDILSYLSVFVSVVLGFLIVYANNFLIKRRKKEIGIYFTLGMSRAKVSLILVLETMIVGIVSLIIGLILGVVLSQLISIFTAKLFEADMTKFAFVFSSDALLYAIVNFGIIYLIVMVFNIMTLGRFKLIDLLYANRRNEKVKIKNSWVIFGIFIISIAMIGYAYKILYDGVMMSGGSDFLVMIILGALGTFLFFLSVAGFLLKVVQLRKKTYYKGLNIFILKQVNNKVNTHVVSTTVISLMLLLTIGILSSSLSMANAMNDSYRDNCPNDFTVLSSQVDKLKDFRNSKTYQDTIKDDYQFSFIKLEGITQGDFIAAKSDKYANMEYVGKQPMQVIKESDYNQILTIQGKDEQIVDLGDNQYQLVATLPMALEFYNEFLEGNNAVKLDNMTLTSKTKKVVELSIINGEGNEGFIVVNDAIAEKYGNEMDGINNYIVGNYTQNNETYENKFIESIDQFNQDNQGKYIVSFTRIQMSDSAIGTSALFTFIGLYLGIVFAISSGTVLAIEQLSESSDNKERYRVLGQLGASRPMINRSLLYHWSTST